MSLNDTIPADVAKRLNALKEGDFEYVVRAASLGLSPLDIARGVSAIDNGEDYPLPGNLGKPRPLVINAWSFVNDHGQYADTYGLSDAEAGELKGLLRINTEEAIERITALVSRRLRERGSTRGLRVTREAMPGQGKTDHAPAHTGAGAPDLKAEIRKSPAIYGMYKFVASDTGRPGPLRFRVPLGAGLYAVAQSKTMAIDVARICRVHGRQYDLIRGYVYLWVNGSAPRSGSDIPSKVEFDGKLKPGEDAPADPVKVEGTVVAK